MQREDHDNRTYTNPIIPGDYPDPSILRVGDDYYMTHSSFQYVPGLLIWHSRDLVNWEPVCHALHTYLGSVWAPDFIRHEDMYYIYFPAGGSNWVVTALDPAGPWSEPVDLKVGFIDPGHIAGPDGQRYLHLSEGYMAPLSKDGLSLTGEPRKVFDGWEYPEEWITEGFCLEGPKLFFKDGYYHLIVAQGGTAGPATSHMVVSARSVNPWGPWELSPFNPIIRTNNRADKWWSRGHGTLVDTPQGNWWIVYHAYENDYYTLGRQTLLEPVDWTEDGWFYVPEGILHDAPILIPMPEGEVLPHGLELSDLFAGPNLGLSWRFWESYDPQRFRIEDGSLLIKGEERTSATCSPLLCIPSDHAYEAEVLVSLQGETEGRLLLFYNMEQYCGVGLSKECLYPIRYSNSGSGRDAVYGRGTRIYLRVRNDRHEVTFHWSEDGTNWRMLPCAMEASSFHHNAYGGFMSLRIGLDAIGNGTVSFSQFLYRSLL